MRLVTIALCLCWAGASQAKTEERVVWGEVTSVQPITEQLEFPPPASCRAAKPANDAGLAALLAWDLQKHCIARRETKTLGYRVSYRWDGRTYTQVMDEDPGRRIPLLLKIR